MQPLNEMASLVDGTLWARNLDEFACRILLHASERLFVAELDYKGEHKPVHQVEQVVTLSENEACWWIVGLDITLLFSSDLSDESNHDILSLLSCGKFAIILIE